MSVYRGVAYECEGCGELVVYNKPWNCGSCGAEVCDKCFDRFTLCRGCTYKKSDAQVLEMARSLGLIPTNTVSAQPA